MMLWPLKELVVSVGKKSQGSTVFLFEGSPEIKGSLPLLLKPITRYHASLCVPKLPNSILFLLLRKDFPCGRAHEAIINF